MRTGNPTRTTLTDEQLRVLREMAHRYVWWMDAADALERPERIVAQVMELGDWDDLQIVARSLGDDYLRWVIVHAEPGQFHERSWHYWHYRLRLAKLGTVPPLPVRTFP
jgi:hypothetical protein